MKTLLFFSISLLFGCASFKEKHKILLFHGVVHTTNGTPLNNVRVTLYEDAFSWNPADWYPRPDRKISQTRTNKRGEFILSTSENISRKKLKIVAERIARLMPYEYHNNYKTPNPIRRPNPEKLNRIVVPDGFVPEP